jgi:1,4-alpha-glucan branching enzyme
MRGNLHSRLLIPFILCSLFLACHCASEWQLGLAKKEAAKIPVRFVYIDGKATTVCISGSFNNWSDQSDCMGRSGNTWSFSATLPPGRHQYGFVIDGHGWREDPRAVLTEDDGFGMKNSVLIVE